LIKTYVLTTWNTDDKSGQYRNWWKWQEAEDWVSKIWGHVIDKNNGKNNIKEVNILDFLWLLTKMQWKLYNWTSNNGGVF
jgi:hypothetical protein